MVDFSKQVYNKYFPKRTPDEYSPGFIAEELQKISFAVDQLSLGQYEVQYVAPSKPRQGRVVYASGGSGWDPGAGEGLYLYTSGGTWSKL